MEPKLLNIDPQISIYELIRFVAIYLRKSRGDEETALKNHEIELVKLCTQNNWKYVIYPEIGTSDSISMRPELTRLLEDIENDIYDAVLIIDFDRLTRGDEEDRGKILKTIRKSETYIVTPEKIYDLDDDNDDLQIGIKGLFAREEYKSIKKRFKRGKKIGSLRGYWTNGIPPFPYEYQSWKDKFNERGLVVNDDKLKTYRFIIDSFLIDRMVCHQIAWELNIQHILSPRGGRWHGEVIRRLLLDESHLGYIITNKTSGDGHKIKKDSSKPLQIIPKEKWIIIKNCHEAVKTEEEHQLILEYLNRKTLAPTRTRQDRIIYPLSGLIKCSICGHTMQVTKREDRRYPDSIKPCWYRDEFGNKCSNRGGITKYIEEEIERQLDYYYDNLVNILETQEQEDEDDVTYGIKKRISNQLQLIDKKNETFQRVKDAYDEGVYSLQDLRERQEKHRKEINELETELKELQKKLKYEENLTTQERIHYIDVFREKIKQENLSGEEINANYKLIIENIIWTRIDDDISVKVNFL